MPRGTRRSCIRRCWTTVAKQKEIGIDIPSDGEAGKVSYSTYMMDRLTGFGGDNERRVALDLQDYPEFREKMARVTGKQEFRRASCIGSIAVKDMKPLETDIANMKAAMKASGIEEGFLNSASPGLVTAFQPNQYLSEPRGLSRGLEPKPWRRNTA